MMVSKVRKKFNKGKIKLLCRNLDHEWWQKHNCVNFMSDFINFKSY